MLFSIHIDQWFYSIPSWCISQTYRVLEKPRRWIQKTFGVALPIFHGRFFTPMPYKMPVKVVIGKPIPTPAPKVKGARPDEDLVSEYHAKYIDALLELHAKNVKDRNQRGRT